MYKVQVSDQEVAKFEEIAWQDYAETDDVISFNNEMIKFAKGGNDELNKFKHVLLIDIKSGEHMAYWFKFNTTWLRMPLKAKVPSLTEDEVNDSIARVLSPVRDEIISNKGLLKSEGMWSRIKKALFTRN